jgi:hypothetical protein
MYKSFYKSIRCFSLVIGHLNLLRSFYYSLADGNVDDKNYKSADLAISKFKNFCKNVVKEIEKLLINQSAEVNFEIKDLDNIKKIVNSFNKPASEGIIDDLFKNLDNINHFIDFLTNIFPHKDINQVDLREIKNELVFFKYQIYLS